MFSLAYFRTYRALFARYTFALFATVWLSVALQPCAMAFEIVNEQTKEAPMAMKQMDESHPCGHCPEPPSQNTCQFEDWGGPDQALNLNEETKPLSHVEKVLTIISLTFITPSVKSPSYTGETPSFSLLNTPTSRNDILRC